MVKCLRVFSANLILVFLLAAVFHLPNQQSNLFASAVSLSEDSHTHEHDDGETSHEHEHSHSPGEPVHSHEHKHSNQLSGFDLKMLGGSSGLVLSHLKTSTRFFIAQHSLRCQDYLQGIFRPPIS